MSKDFRSLADLLVGHTLADRYRVEERIGSGGMSVIYRATDLRLDRDVAVKVVSLPPDDAARGEEHRRRLQREAASAARIAPHPNVVQIYDYGTDPALGLDFIAMELLPGRDLRSALRGGPLPLPTALALLEDAARGVAAGHDAGIVHRDVKPGNVWLVPGEDGESAKILDFGIAKGLAVPPEEELTRTGAIPLSPAYASPEQARGAGELTPASDVFQLGLLGYELLTGERPFDESERERIQAGEEVVLPSRGRWQAVPPAARAVLERALRVRPEDRFPDAGAFADALSDSDADRTVLLPDPGPAAGAPPPTSARRPRAPRVDPRLLAAVAAGALLLVLVVVAGRGRTAAPARAVAGVADTAGLEVEFRDLYLRAYRAQQERGSSLSGQAAADAVAKGLTDLTDALTAGDLPRHLAHYAPRVVLDGREISRDRLGELRRETIDRYPRRQVTLKDLAIHFAEPGRARVLVTSSWDFRGEGHSWKGAARREYLFARSDGEWEVVSERELERYGSSRR